MAFNLTQEQYDSSLQVTQTRYVRVELLNYQFQTVENLEGKCTSGNISIAADSDIRRTGNITIAIDNSTFEVEPGGKIFLDKYLRIWVGTYNYRADKIAWTNCGIYIIDAPSYHYDLASNTLTISLLDLMAKMTGVRNGYLQGVPVVFKAGSKLRDAIIAMLKLAGFTRYIVEDPPFSGEIPIDLEFGQGTTVYNVLKGLVDLYPQYEMFFDVNGTFVYQKIPTGEHDPVIIEDKVWKNIVMNEDVIVDFQNVKNSIEVYGRTHDPARFSATTTVDGNQIHLSIADVYHYFDGLIYGFTLTDNPGYSDMYLEINELGPLPIFMDDDSTPADIPSESGEVYYCVQYKGDHWLWLGHLQAYGFAEEDDESSPFYVDGTVGRIRLPLFGGEYDNIFTDDLAMQRAEYELYLHSSLNDSVTLTCVPAYWMDVNILVEYTSNRQHIKDKYIIKSLNMGLGAGDTMSVQMMRYRPKLKEIEWDTGRSFLEWNKDKKSLPWNKK